MQFILRWVVNSFGIWMAVTLLNIGTITRDDAVWIYLLAGLIFSCVNATLKPLVIFLSLPALIITLGLFMIVVNGIMVWIALALAPWISISFFGAILAGLLLSLLNYVVSNVAGLKQ